MIEVQIGGSGEVLVPFESNIKVYAGKDIDVQGIQGQVDAYSGLNLNLQDVYRLGNASAGGTMNIDCQTMTGKDVTFGAGRDLRFHVADLTSARLRVKDIGGYWEARIGGGEKSVTLKSGGDVTFVTDQTGGVSAAELHSGEDRKTYQSIRPCLLMINVPQLRGVVAITHVTHAAVYGSRTWPCRAICETFRTSMFSCA